MAKEFEMTEMQIWGVRLLGNLFDALRNDQTNEFLQSEELQRFLAEARRRAIVRGNPFSVPGMSLPGEFLSNPLDALNSLKDGLGYAGSLPDGSPGSNFGGLGNHNLMDVLHDLFHGIGSDLLGADHSGGVDPAATGSGGHTTVHDDPDGTHTVVTDDGHGNIETVSTHPDRTREVFNLNDNGGSSGTRADPNGGVEWWYVEPDGRGGAASNHGFYQHYGPDGRPSPRAPGEDGGASDTNTARNPLSGIDVLAPQSMEQMLGAYLNPIKDSELDPNVGGDGFSITEEQQQRAGLVAPALEVLDPNSGIDPTSQFTFDPSQFHTRSEDDELDQNTGLDRPLPG